MTIRARWATLLLLFALTSASIPARAQDTPTTSGYSAETTSPPYADPSQRFGLTPPPSWYMLADKDPNEVTFQNKTGDNLRVTIESLRVPRDAFLATYVDTYLEVLSQAFTDVKFLGKRTTVVGTLEAQDYSFAATLGTSPVLCRQVVLFGGDQVLYLTFAGYGVSRDVSEQLFNIALTTVWVAPTFGGKTAGAATTGDSAFPFTFRLPQNWVEYAPPAPDTRVYRPANAREMSALITAFSAKPSANTPTVIGDEFAKVYGTRICDFYKPAPCQIASSSRVRLGGEPAVRYDYSFASNTNLRRVAVVFTMHNGRLFGVACEAASAAFPSYEKDFEAVFATYKFE